MFKICSFIICTFHALILCIENSFENSQEDENFVWHSFIHMFVLHSLTHLSMCQMCFQCMIFKCKIYEPMTQWMNFAKNLSLFCCMLHLWWLNLSLPFSKNIYSCKNTCELSLIIICVAISTSHNSWTPQQNLLINIGPFLYNDEALTNGHVAQWLMIN